MTDSFFFLQVDKNDQNQEIINQVEEYAGRVKKQFYIINKPLTEQRYSYSFENAIVILSPNHKIIFVNFSSETDKFDEFVDDFTEDLGFISDKFQYRKVIGRPRVWSKELTTKVSRNEIDDDFEKFISDYEITEPQSKRTCELLISLLTGSINDIERVKGDVPDSLLDRIKQKILLFDGDQTRFIYQPTENKRTTIQGLSGTGKTELLLHKLKDIYVNSDDCKVILTCHNIILADTLRNRIPNFFDFMKVEQQIKWNERLWCVHSWGSKRDENTGAYSRICNFYGLMHHSYSVQTPFDWVCKKALKELNDGNLIEEYGYAFDYILIDESQDLPDSFFEICELVAKEKVYIAGDIFQSIFDDEIVSEINPDFLLNKCYRTDPKTLMFAHALGMGLFEKPKLRWLDEKEWNACGYNVDKSDPNEFVLSREPLRRFEDLVIPPLLTDGKNRIHAAIKGGRPPFALCGLS